MEIVATWCFQIWVNFGGMAVLLLFVNPNLHNHLHKVYFITSFSFWIPVNRYFDKQ